MARGVNLRLGADITDFEAKMQKASKSFKKTGAALKKTGKAMTMGLTAPLLAFAGASVKAFDSQAKAEAKLNSALKGNEKAFKSLKVQAQELQKVTIFGDEETMAAQSMLASMGLEEEAILRLSPLIQDMATAKGINLSADDAPVDLDILGSVDPRQLVDIELMQGEFIDETIYGSNCPQIGQLFQKYKIDDKTFSNYFGEEDLGYDSNADTENLDENLT